MVEDGGTLIVGGIYEEESTNAVNKVPVLGDILLSAICSNHAANVKTAVSC